MSATINAVGDWHEVSVSNDMEHLIVLSVLWCRVPLDPRTGDKIIPGFRNSESIIEHHKSCKGFRDITVWPYSKPAEETDDIHSLVPDDVGGNLHTTRDGEHRMARTCKRYTFAEFIAGARDHEIDYAFDQLAQVYGNKRKET